MSSIEKFDWRKIENGLRIPAITYSDQPYVVRTDDGAWLCCITTGSGAEGAAGQHVITTRSTDCGKSWSEPVAVEPPDGIENSYAVMLKAPGGRIFIFYTRNSDNVREILTHDRKQTFTRVDCLGHFVFKYSDDHGRSWSAERYDIPFRLFRCDRDNVYGGKLCFFWNVGHPFAYGGSAFVSLIKVGEMGDGFYQQSEGCLLKSPNLFTVSDPADAVWETLPDGDVGLRAPAGGGRVSEEQNFLALSDGSFYVTYRTVDGYSVEAYSRDGGHTWSAPRYMQHLDGRRVKHPRAANFAWRCGNGNYLYWFHNHGGRFVGEEPRIAYEDRNPVWLLPGVEADSPEGKVIRWGEPEILLYSDNPMVRMSYPDLVEEDGRYFFTETEKNLALLHEVPAAFLEKMWTVAAGKSVVPDVPVLFASGPGPAELPAADLPELFKRNQQAHDFHGERTRAGFAITGEIAPGASGLLLGNRASDGRGLALEYTSDRRLVLTLDDGAGESRMVSEPVPELRKFAVIVDGGPAIVSFVADGKFLDGGDDRQFGWRRFNPELIRRPNRSPWRVGAGVLHLKFWNDRLQTADAVSLTR